MEKKRSGFVKGVGFSLRNGVVQENGQGSATDMVRRESVRQTSERDVGMLDILDIISTHQEIVVGFYFGVGGEENRILLVSDLRILYRESF